MNKVYVGRSKGLEVVGIVRYSVIRGNCFIIFCQGRNVLECISREIYYDLNSEYKSIEKKMSRFVEKERINI